VATQHYLPSKVIPYLRRLQLEYDRLGNPFLSSIVKTCRVVVREETSYSDYNGTYGHDVIVFVPPDVIKTMSLKRQGELGGMLCDDLNKCANVDNEHFRAVALEMADEADPEYQKASLLSSRPLVDPDTLTIWEPGCIRLFVTHRDTHKHQARALADELIHYGISAFVAHDTIEPMEKWQAEILKGLETMEVMLAFVTDDFNGSVWTNQELGYALGRNVPIIALKVERADPLGFVGINQALRGDASDPKKTARQVYRLLAEKLGQKSRLQRALVTAFATSPNFDETRAQFDMLSRTVSALTDEETALITTAFEANDKLHKAIYLTNHYHRLLQFMQRTTGRTYHYDGIKLVPERVTDEIPF
jgi:TIR domain